MIEIIFLSTSGGGNKKRMFALGVGGREGSQKFNDCKLSCE